METRSTLVASIAALAAAYVAVVVLDLGGAAPLLGAIDAATSAASAATGSGRAPSVHDLTQPLRRVAFGSCNDQSMEQPLWRNIAAYEPELWLWMGDNIYADIREAHEPMAFPPSKMFTEATGDVLRERYAKLLANPEYHALAQKTPVIGIWDDHDFGINDAHKGYTHRVESQQIFLDFMNEPADSPRRTQEGIYTSYTVGTGDQTVKFILVDNRYNRDSYDTDGGDLLGAAQWAWLERELRTTTAAFNVIVSGIQVLANDRFSLAEGWCRFPHQRERLLELILASKAKGVILLSGDVHFSEVNQVVCSDGANVLTEITSSGMTHSWMQFHRPELRFLPGLLFTYANLLLPWEFRPSQDAFYGFLNWGQLEFDWERKPVPVATVQVRGRDNEVKLQHEFTSTPAYSETPGEDAAACRPAREIAVWRRALWQLAFVGVVGFFILSVLVNAIVTLLLAWFFASTLAVFAARSAQKLLLLAKEKDESQVARRPSVGAMLDLVEQFRRKQLCRRVYEKRVGAINARERELRRENALREEIASNMKDLVATSLQSAYRGWRGRCIAAVVRRRHCAAIQIQRIARGLLARKLAARERRKLRQVLHSPVALKLLLARSRVVRTVKNWQELLDSHTNEHFYFHVFTHDSQWLPPEPFHEFLCCKWPACEFIAKTVHEIHEHYRTLHIWYCPVCMAKVSTWTFPQCPICMSVCSHDPVTGEIIGPGEMQLHAIQQAKDAEDELKRQKEEMQQHRMAVWAELVAQEDTFQIRARRKKSRLGFGGKTASVPSSSTSSAASGGELAESLSEEDAEIAQLVQIDPSLMHIQWITAVQRKAKESRVFAKALLPHGSLYVGDFHPKNRRFDGFGEILYVSGGKYVGQWKDNQRSGRGIYQNASGNEYIGEWLAGLKHGMGIHTLATGERYVGQFVEGELQGFGALFAANGDKYEGEFVANRPSGYGKFKRVNGDRFVGTTVNGQAQGVGILAKSDGEVYKGQWENDFRHGRGVCFYPNGAVYSGEWWHGRWSGNGVYISSEGIKYIGEFSNGEKHGIGKLVFDNGDLFDGYFVHDVAHGEGATKGIYRFRESGNTYIGGWANNKREGKGTYMFRDGSVFSGYFYNDHAQGRGKMSYTNGNTYKGEFLHAEKHGEGVYRWKNGSVYEGQFAHGLIHGFGKMMYASGHRYEGHWERNKKHGRGSFFYQNGDLYEGDWVADHRHGQGKFTWNPGTLLQESFEGTWDMDRRHGRGKYCYTNGTSYDGEWVYGKREGSAVFKWPNGDFYDGQFANEMQHGIGSFYSAANGDVYTGDWVENVREGRGKIVYASGKVFEGTFHEGRRHGDGILTYPDGNRFRGTWNRDKKQGGGSYLLNVGSTADENENSRETISIRVFGH